MDTAGFRASQRIKAYVERVLAPAVFALRSPLSVAVHQSREPLTPRQARALPFEPVTIGWRWGPVWSTAWFRLSGQVPGEMAGRQVVLRFSSGTEAQLWRGDEPWHGLDANHDEVPITAVADERIDVLVEAACNHPLGATMFFWDSAEAHARWQEDKPGRLELAELAVVEPGVRRLMTALDLARGLVEAMDDPTPVMEGVEGALAGVDLHDPARTAEDSCSLVRRALAGRAAPGRGFAVGHAHIDTAWLWTIEETKRKCVRTFSTVLDLMDRHEDFRFLCTSPQHLAWVRERSSALFARIARRVDEGRWEMLGATWIEPDAVLPAGESLVRQIVHALGFLGREFPRAPRVRTLYLPDSFGFGASLPQIMRLAGLEVFVTNKLWWSEHREFPHVRFRWRGIDGSEVLAHLTPSMDYNAANTGKELVRAASVNARLGGGGCFLMPFGFGDGGGGPTAEMIERARLAGDAAGSARITLDGARAFETAFRQEAAGGGWPTHEGGLDLERHRGTYTVQARIKAGNARAEAALRRAEWLAAGAPGRCAASGDVRRALEEAWERLLLNQFHDILPGSCIGPVAQRASSELAEVRGEADRISCAAMASWGPGGETAGFLVFNPCSRARSGWVEAGGRCVFVRDVPGLGAKWVEATGDDPPRAAGFERSGDGFVLDNGRVRAVVGPCGRVRSLVREGGVEAAAAPLNQLVLYDDVPRNWEAWDIDEEHLRSARPIETRAERVSTGHDGHGAWVEFERALGRASRLVQRVSLAGGDDRVVVRSRVEWRESRTLLRVLCPTRVRTDRAAYEIAFGHIERPVRRADDHDPMFEVPGHRWAWIGDEGAGFALLNDCKYGHSCRADGSGTTLGLTLLRSAKFPDPDADMGEHDFRYALLPTLPDALDRALDEGEAMADDLFAVERPGSAWSWAPITVSGRARVTAVKPGRREGELVVRLHERSGLPGEVEVAWGLPVEGVRPLDLLEEPRGHAGFVHSGGVTRLAVGPFEIITLGAIRA